MTKYSLIKNIFYKIILNIFKIVTPLLFIPYVYRLFSPDIIGKIEFSQSIMNYFFIFSGFGVYTYGLREISKIRDNKEKRDKLFVELFFISIISSTVVFILYVLYINMKFSLDKVLKEMLMINSITLLSSFFYIEWINEAFENYKFITKKTIIIKLISLGSMFLFLKKEIDFYKYLYIINITVLMNNLLSFIYIKQYINISLKKINLKKYIWPLFIIVLINNVNVLYTNLDKIFLGFNNNIIEIAYYGIGQKVMSVIFVLTMSIITVSMPRLSYYLENDNEKYIILLNKIIKHIGIIIFPLSIGTYILKDEVVLFFGGEKYGGASIILGLFALRIIILVYENILSNQIIFLHKKENVMIIILGMCGIINIVFKYILSKKYLGISLSGTTAIMSTMIAETIIILIDLYYIKKKLGLKMILFPRNMYTYIGLSLIFLIINKVIRKFNLDMIGTVFFIIISCIIFYMLGLYLLKDECLIEALKKIKKQKKLN